jgi:very-short-patch-repair endonuclease
MSYIGKTREPAFLFYADQTTIDLAKKLRQKMTPSEKALWQRLKSQKIDGYKFRRQHPIKYYIADFYCHEARLVIEVDGPIHDRIDQREHDLQRSGIIEDFGIMILRFTNDEIKYHINTVLKEIKEITIMRTRK